MKVLYFPWPPAPPEVMDLKLDCRKIQELVGGMFEAHTLAMGCAIYCDEDGRYKYEGGPNPPYAFPYTGFDLPGPEDGQDFRVHIFKTFEEMMATPRKTGHIDVYGPCLLVGPADEDGEETDVPDWVVELFQGVS